MNVCGVLVHALPARVPTVVSALRSLTGVDVHGTADGGRIVVTVEDHYAEGGLGDAVAGELSCAGVQVHKLAVRELPRSGKAEELLAKFGIDAAAIVKQVKALVSA